MFYNLGYVLLDKKIDTYMIDQTPDLEARAEGQTET